MSVATLTDAIGEHLTGEARRQEKRAIRAEAQAALFREKLEVLSHLLDLGFSGWQPELTAARDGAKKALFENRAPVVS